MKTSTIIFRAIGILTVLIIVTSIVYGVISNNIALIMLPTIGGLGFIACIGNEME